MGETVPGPSEDLGTESRLGGHVKTTTSGLSRP